MAIKNWLIFVGLACLLAFFMADLAIPGLPMFHDVNPHISRAIAYHTALQDGQYPPMWAKEVLGGIGSPVLMLNYQLPYMMGEAWHRLGATIFNSYKLTLGITYVLSGLFMYLALRKRYGKPEAWAGAIIYSLAPYRFVDIYVRGALGESISFMFPPLLILGLTAGSIPLQILGWAGLFLTHPVASAAFSAFFLGYTLIYAQKGQILKKIKDFFVPYVIALSIAMFNILPTLALTKYTYYSPSLSDTLLMFPTFSQLVHSPWGYGVSLPGPKDGMSFEIGLVPIIILILGIIFAFKKDQKELKYLSFASLTALFFILPISTTLYKLFLGNIIDFPWRLLLCIVFATAWTGALLIDKVPNNKKKLIVILITVIMVWQAMGMAHTKEYWPASKDIKFFARETGDSYGEYAPITRVTRESSPFWKRVEYISGEGTITTLVDKSNEQSYLVRTTKAGEVRINTTYFPGWVIQDSCYVTKRYATHIDDSGLIACFVDIGETTLTIKYEAPTAQKLGNLITLAGIGTYLWILFQSFYLPTTKKTR
ncbi:MAG: hypothetical protein WAV40_02285 [Microgenomates group bacterium]